MSSMNEVFPKRGAGLWPVGQAGVSPAQWILSTQTAGVTPACPTAETAAPQTI